MSILEVLTELLDVPVDQGDDLRMNDHSSNGVAAVGRLVGWSIRVQSGDSGLVDQVIPTVLHDVSVAPLPSRILLRSSRSECGSGAES